MMRPMDTVVINRIIIHYMSLGIDKSSYRGTRGHCNFENVLCLMKVHNRVPESRHPAHVLRYIPCPTAVLPQIPIS